MALQPGYHHTARTTNSDMQEFSRIYQRRGRDQYLSINRPTLSYDLFTIYKNIVKAFLQRIAVLI